MSLQIFCFSCGSPTEYTLSKPNFCSKCGKGFIDSVAASPAKPKSNIIKVEDFSGKEQRRIRNKPLKRPTRFAENDKEEDDEDDGITEVPQIQGLDLEISAPPEKGIKFGALLKGAEAPSGFNRPKAKKVSKKEILEQLKREGGTGRGEPIEIGE